jgi:CTP synthase
MQIATIEFARNVCKLKDANSTEFDEDTPHPVVSLQEEQKKLKTMGNNMRLGSCESILFAGTLAAQLYNNADRINERHRHRYEFNSDYQEQLQEKGLVVSAVSANEGLVEIIELPSNKFFIACQFHPEFQSKPNKPHPLFAGFIKAALEKRMKDEL